MEFWAQSGAGEASTDGKNICERDTSSGCFPKEGPKYSTAGSNPHLYSVDSKDSNKARLSRSSRNFAKEEPKSNSIFGRQGPGKNYPLSNFNTKTPPDNRISISLDSPGEGVKNEERLSVIRKNSLKKTKIGVITSVSKDGSPMRFVLKDDETTIGRKLECTIPLHCQKISKKHACIAKKDNGYTITDLNSANGVRVNNKYIPRSSPIDLKNKDKISIGTFDLKFEFESFEEAHNAKETENKETLNTEKLKSSPLQKVHNTETRKSRLRAENTRSILDSSKPKPATDTDSKYTKLVTILPSEKKYEKSVTIRAELDAEPDTEFKPFSEVKDMDTIQEDYEKLRLAYELSKTFSLNITEALSKSCEIMFEILPLDRAVVLLVDNETRMLVTHYVRVRKGGKYNQKEICLSSNILRKVVHTRKALITSDASEDPMLNRHASVKHGQIKSVICVPLMTRDQVLGVLHLDSRNSIATLSKKDLSLVVAVGSQTAMAIENSMLVKEMKNKVRLTEQFSRFLPPYVVEKMTKNKGERISAGGRDAFGTIVFSDIRGFTSLSERTVPSEVVNLLNDYFERLVAIVFKYNGVVDKYIGDALMAVFGTLEHERTESEFRAVSAALEFKEAIREMNAERHSVNKEPIAIGIGLNTGELLAGFIGCSQRLEYTCIGDTVNTSSRICSLAGVNQILASQSTWEAIRDRVVSVPVGYKQLKGKDKEIMMYEVIAIKDDKDQGSVEDDKD